MRSSILLSATILAVSAAVCSAAGLREEMTLDGQWQAAQTRSDAATPPADGWRQVNVPGTFWSTAEEGSTFVWLRRDVAVPADWRSSS